MSFRRVPREIDPRRPPKRNAAAGEAEERRTSTARSYGQYVDLSRDDLEDLEDVTDEVAREGSESDGDGDSDGDARSRRRTVEDREAFEDATDEVSREDGESRS